MLPIKTVATLAFIAGIFASPVARQDVNIEYPTGKGCGEVNVFYTGFPPHHELVAAQGYNSTDADVRLRSATAKLVRAGFNVQILWQGPEQPLSNLADRLATRQWDVTGVGYGMRGSTITEVVTRFEENLIQYRESTPLAPTVFDWGPDALFDSVTRHVTLTEDCTDKPGILYVRARKAYEEVCTDACTSTINVLDGSLDELLDGI